MLNVFPADTARTTRACALLLVLLAAAQTAAANLPVTGQQVAEFAAVDTLLQNFMSSRAIPGATLAITHHGDIVYERGFGYSDAGRSVPMSETAQMRLASVTKPVTASAIQQLAKDGRLGLDDKVFNVGGNGGILDITPYNGMLGDARLADVTVRQLLQHKGGWNRNAVGDLAFRDAQIAQAMGLPGAPGVQATARYILSQPLQFTPGANTAYSNIGYMFLGMVVEARSGQSYEDYVDGQVLAHAGIPAWEINAGRTFRTDQDPREPHYNSLYRIQNVFDPAGPTVPGPYGGWDHEKALAYGGLIGSAKAVAQLATDRIAAGPEIGTLRADYTTLANYWWYHTGSLDGTDTLMLQASWKDWTYAILFNQRPGSGSYAESLVNGLQSILDGVGHWPAPLRYAGDFTGDQWLTEDDIELFCDAVALGSNAAFAAAHPGASYLAGDFDDNGIVDGLDLYGFKSALQHAGLPAGLISQVPEPAGITMAAAGLLLIAALRRREVVNQG